MRKIIVPFLLIVALSISSCGDNTTDVTAPTIEILAPENNSSFYYGDSFDIKVKVSDEGGVAGVKYELFPVHDEGVKLEGVKNGFVLSSYVTDFEDSFKINLPKGYQEGEQNKKYDDAEYYLEFYAEDFDKNVEKKQILITITNKL